VFLVAASIQAYGWRATAVGSGIIAILAGWPLAGVIRSRPEDHGETRDGVPPASKDDDAAAAAPVRDDFSAGEAIRTSAFWLIALGHAFALLAVSAVNVHAVTHIKEGLGYSLSLATLMFTLVTVGQFAGVMTGWVIGDRYVKRKVAAVCMLMHAGGLLMLTYATGPFMLAVAALVHGAAWGLRGPFMQAIRADYFGRSSIGMIIGLSSAIVVIGNIVGPVLAGAFADWTGNYRMGFTILAVMCGAGSLFFMAARRPRLN
jgi:predicted MFS family arabinose efflux permease